MNAFYSADQMGDRPPSNLSSNVFSVLRERIVRWEYPPGHRFTEEALCEEFGMSRSPVREALRMLVENKLVDKTPHKGYSVIQLDLRQIHELYDVRLALETFVMERIIEGGYPEEEWEALHRTWSSLQKSLQAQPAEFAVKDEEFHERLATWTGNLTLLQEIQAIDDRLHFIRMTDIVAPGRLMATCVQHLRILDCIKERNAAGAQDAVRTNIEDGRLNVETAIKEALARAYLGSKTGA